MLPTWKEEITIRSFDVDCQNRLQISNLCSFFQEVAEHHAGHMGFGFTHMRKAGLVWVLSRLEITFSAYPKWGDTITIETWPMGNERLYYRREFLVTGKGGEKLIAATSFWLLINLQSRRPKVLPMPYEIDEQNTGRYAVQAMTTAIPSPSPEETVIVPVKYGDLDINQHVNNARYVYWITDFFPVDFHVNHRIEFFRIDIKQEVKDNESVKITKERKASEYILEGRICNRNAICFQAMVSFRDA
ncbi:MAG: hypothetical protein JW973_13125 [Bacteroidales bacterium]|nr:hypothetical protein [Bacteroidales bacterium]